MSVAEPILQGEVGFLPGQNPMDAGRAQGTPTS